MTGQSDWCVNKTEEIDIFRRRKTLMQKKTKINTKGVKNSAVNVRNI